MVPVAAQRFDLAECNTHAEAAFVSALHARAEAGGWYADSWLWDDRVIVTVDVSDPMENCVLRMLRVDFRDGAVAFGPDETCQLATDLDPAQPGMSVRSGQPASVLANAAADWLEWEMRRPIVRHEWNRLDCRGVAPRLWVLADTGEGLVGSGQLGPDFGPPDRVVAVTGADPDAQPDAAADAS